MRTERAEVFDRNNVVEAIKRLREEDLIFLNHLIIERLNLITQAKSTCLMARFAAGDRVSFHAPDGSNKEGIIIKLNKKTASVKLFDGHIWKVSPGFLEKIGAIYT